MLKKILILNIIQGFLFGGSVGGNLPEIEILQGKLRGKTLISRDGREYYGFLGVPYAKAQRFMAPKPATNWKGTLDATEYRAQCAQSMWTTNENIGEENCLHLQIFTPTLTGKLPVMVYFHGGGFTIGTGNVFGAQYLMDEDIVLVFVNYRLGPFGFLSMQDAVFPGNNGLKDQNMALRWVRGNIGKFGGDPGSVTLFGNSAGGASANFHMLSPQSSGLLHGAIAQSGSSLNPWAISRNPKEMARRFGKSLGCPTQTSNHLYICLLTKKTDEILDAMEPLVQWGYDPFTPFGAVVEPKLPGAFLTEEPEMLMKTGRFNKVPLMTGVTEHEGLLMHAAYVLNDPKLVADINENWKKVFPVTFEFDEFFTNLTTQEKLKLSTKVREFYFQNRPIDQETKEELIHAYSDRFFNHGVRKAALSMANHTPVYMYMFGHVRGDYSILRFFGIDAVLGVPHGEELSFVFANSFGLAPEFNKGSAAERVSKDVVKLWASFARDKKPAALWGKQQNWPAICEEQILGEKPIQYYHMDEDTQLINEPFTDRLKFWDKALA